MDEVILVDENDLEIGSCEKLLAHTSGKLHRAFSIILFNDKKEILIQQRAKNKYHCPLLWSNSCCSHPRPNENIVDAANRRLFEELRIKCDIKEVFVFSYSINFNSQISENEVDHVFIGKYDGEIPFNNNEIEDIQWISINELKEDIKKNPLKYSYWFNLILEKLSDI